MKKSILLSIFVTLSILGFGQKENEYTKFHTGTFTYESSGEDVIIKRTKTRQTETYNDGKSKVILKIKWENDSTYILTHIKSVNVGESCLKKSDSIKSVIMVVEGNKCFVRFSTKNCGQGACHFIKKEDE
jgi:hypothetical protein